MEKTIEIVLSDYVGAKDGSLLIRKNGKWHATTFDELNKHNKKELSKIDDLQRQFDVLAEHTKHFKKYAISHFLVVFLLFKTKVMEGEIELEDESLLQLDSKVITKEISVKDALAKHEYLQTTFESIFNDDETIVFPEV